MIGWNVRTSGSAAVNSCLIPSRVKPMTLTLVFTAYLLDLQHLKDSVENKPASLLVPLKKSLNGIPSPLNVRYRDSMGR